MVDFSAFDSILDFAFVIDGDGKIVYCNDAAATFCQSSVRRLSGKAVISDIFSLQEPGILPFTAASQGRTAPSPFIETALQMSKVEKTAKVQIAVRPIAENNWLFYVRDVSLEEVLAAKYRAELAKTEEYARNLEKLVEARTAELKQVNQTLKAILNSLGQGFFTFNAEGDCGPVFTKACEDVLEGVPTGRKAWEMLGVPAGEIGQFKKWSESIFKEFLPFDDMKGLGQSLYPHSQKRHVTLEYYPIRNAEGAIQEIVVVATDKTSEFEAQKALEAERQYAGMIVKYTKNKDQFLQFLASVREGLKALQAFCASEMLGEAMNESFRLLHTLEGEAGTFSLGELRRLSRASQHLLEPFKGKAKLEPEAQAQYKESLTVMQTSFEAFLKANGELFRVPEGEVDRSVEMPMALINGFLEDLRKTPGAQALAGKFQEQFLKVSIESCLRYFDSLVQMVAEKLGKKVHPIVIEGGDVRIYPEPYQKLFSNMVHAFRNAVDHGLEEPTEREWGGKDPAGTIRVKIASAGGRITMIISDDGKGIDPAVIREKLKSKFPDRDFLEQSDDEIIQTVCMPGFSSRETVGEFSGRGVGLDALREEVLKIGGDLHIKSKVGEGTTLELSFPELAEEPAILRSA
jgi:two-component system chemotaxis sensor kinase CheA